MSGWEGKIGRFLCRLTKVLDKAGWIKIVRRYKMMNKHISIVIPKWGRSLGTLIQEINYSNCPERKRSIYWTSLCLKWKNLDFERVVQMKLVSSRMEGWSAGCTHRLTILFSYGRTAERRETFCKKWIHQSVKPAWV